MQNRILCTELNTEDVNNTNGETKPAQTNTRAWVKVQFSIRMQRKRCTSVHNVHNRKLYHQNGFSDVDWFLST